MSGLSDQERARNWFDQTRRIHLSPNPDLHKVVAGYRKSLEFMPNNAEVIYFLGVALLGKREWTNAEEQFRKALRLTPDYADAHFHLGQTLMQMRRPEEAEQSFRKSIELVPKERRGPLYITLALALQGQFDALAQSARDKAMGKLKQAEECFRLGLEQLPQDLAARYQFALFLFNLGNLTGQDAPLTESESLLDAILAEQPGQRDVLNLRALQHSRRGNLADAIALLERALELARNDAGLLFNLAQIVEQSGDTQRARNLLEESLALQPQQPGALSRLAGIIANEDKDWARAMDLIEKGLALSPRDATLLFQKALVLKSQAADLPEGDQKAQLDEVRALVEQVLRIQPAFQPAQVLAAELGGGPLPTTAPAVDVEELERRLAEAPGDSELKLQVLQARLSAQRLPEALPLLEELLQERPEDPMLLVNHGMVLSYVAGQDGQRLTVARNSLRKGISLLSTPDAPMLLRLAQLNILLREPEEAQDLLGQLMALVGTDPRLEMAQLLQLSGVAAQQKGFLEDAAELFHQATQALDERLAQGVHGSQLDGALRESWGSLAQTLDLLRRDDEAIAAQIRWSQITPGDGNVLFRLAGLYNRNGRFEEGLETLHRLEVLAPENPVTQYYTALTLMDLNRTAEAENCLLKALELKPDFPEAQQRLQFLQQNRPLVASTLEELEQSVQEDPDDLDDRLLLSQAYLNAKEWEKAATQLDVVVAGDPKNHKALFDLSNAWLAAGNKDKAIDCLIQLEQRLPNDPGVRFRLAELLLDNDEEELAVKEYKNAVDMQPNNPVFQFRYGVALKQADREDKAEQAIRRALELQPNFSAAHFQLGLLEYTSERHEAALRSFVTSFQQDQQNFQALYYCGMIHSGVLKNTREAVKFFQSALGIHPAHGDSHFQLGRLFLEQSRQTDARRHLERALELWPQDAFNRGTAEDLLASANEA